MSQEILETLLGTPGGIERLLAQAQLGERVLEILRDERRGSGKQMAALFDIIGAARELGLLPKEGGRG